MMYISNVTLVNLVFTVKNILQHESFLTADTSTLSADDSNAPPVLPVAALTGAGALA